MRRGHWDLPSEEPSEIQYAVSDPIFLLPLSWRLLNIPPFHFHPIFILRPAPPRSPPISKDCFDLTERWARIQIKNLLPNFDLSLLAWTYAFSSQCRHAILTCLKMWISSHWIYGKFNGFESCSTLFSNRGHVVRLFLLRRQRGVPSNPKVSRATTAMACERAREWAKESNGNADWPRFTPRSTRASRASLSHRNVL